jgi:hypothetical protein
MNPSCCVVSTVHGAPSRLYRFEKLSCCMQLLLGHDTQQRAQSVTGSHSPPTPAQRTFTLKHLSTDSQTHTHTHTLACKFAYAHIHIFARTVTIYIIAPTPSGLAFPEGPPPLRFYACIQETKEKPPTTADTNHTYSRNSSGT